MKMVDERKKKQKTENRKTERGEGKVTLKE